MFYAISKKSLRYAYIGHLYKHRKFYSTLIGLGYTFLFYSAFHQVPGGDTFHD